MTSGREDDRMPDLMANIVGVAAGLCSMASFVPQIAKIVKDRDASGVSLRMFAVTVTAFVLWTLYGVFLGSWPIIASNAVCLALSGVILALRFLYGGGGAQQPG
jgi:MtN3 and saliva related transmembrane protein